MNLTDHVRDYGVLFEILRTQNLQLGGWAQPRKVLHNRWWCPRRWNNIVSTASKTSILSDVAQLGLDDGKPVVMATLVAGLTRFFTFDLHLEMGWRKINHAVDFVSTKVYTSTFMR